VNEHGLVIGNQAVFSNEIVERRLGLIVMNLLRLALEHARNRNEAVDCIGIGRYCKRMGKVERALGRTLRRITTVSILQTRTVLCSWKHWIVIGLCAKLNATVCRITSGPAPIGTSARKGSNRLQAAKPTEKKRAPFTLNMHCDNRRSLRVFLMAACEGRGTSLPRRVTH